MLETSFDGARQTRYDDCVAGRSTHSRCNEITTCFNNPFIQNALCSSFSIFTEERVRLENLCTVADNFQTMKDAECVAVRDSAPCAENPFTIFGGCLTDKRDIVVKARANRISYCSRAFRFTQAGNAEERDVCAPALYYCHLNPTDSDCQTQQTTGITQEDLGDIMITGTIQDTINNICVTEGHEDSEFCGLNSARWAEHSYTYVDDSGTPNDASDDIVTDVAREARVYKHYTDVPTEIVRGSETEAKIGFLHGANSGLGDRTRVLTKDLAGRREQHFEANFTDTYQDGDNKNTIGFLGGATGGFIVSYFQNFDKPNFFEIYAGLAPDTNVGALLPNSKPTATWSGIITLRTGGALSKSKNFDFELTVDFNNERLTLAQRIDEVESRFALNERITVSFKNVKYDAAGLISGQVETGVSGIATLTGLIGESGAVGVFLNDRMSGGFIASPKVGLITSRQFNNWRTNSRGTRGTTFDRGDDLTIRTEISKTDATANFLTAGTSRQYLRLAEGLEESDATLTPNTPITTLTLADSYFDSDDLIANLNGDSTNGVSLFAVDVATEDDPMDKTTRFYSGLLAETTLTPFVLDEMTPVATWKGKFAMLYNKTTITGDAPDTMSVTAPFIFEKDDFAIDIHFTSQPYSSASVGRRFSASVTVPHSDGTSNDVSFAIAGTFSASGLLRGRITGADSYGDITGLVGTNGLVASFVSTATTGAFGSYVGGFVAVPEGKDGLTRTPPAPNFQTWSHLAVTNTEVTPATDPVSYTRLTILDGISLTDNKLLNFVVGRATALSRNILGGGTIEKGVISLDYGTINANYADRGTKSRDFSIPLTLTLGDIYSHGEKDFNLDGDVADGVSFVQGLVGTNYRFYTGILSGTDLGSQVTASGTWKGRFYLYDAAVLNNFQFSSHYREAVDFTLDVAFNAGSTTSGTINNKPGFLVDSGAFTIDGRFNDKGIISGTILYSTGDGDLNGVLSGLIGAEGLVAVFTGQTESGSYITGGGFVARPSDDVIETTGTLTTADWLRGFNFEDRVRVGAFEKPAHFLRGDKNGLVDDLKTDSNPDGFDSLPVTQISLGLNDDDKDGVAFFAGEKDGVTRYYAGLLSTTDVGKHLDGGTASATWNGTIGVISGNIYDENTFELTVNFNEQTISASGITLGAKTNVMIEGSWKQTIREVFAPNKPPTTLLANPRGRIEGTITGLDAVDAVVDTNGVEITPASSGVDGILTGLIGSGGAVGAFISGADSTALYAGGFVANPVCDYRG